MAMAEATDSQNRLAQVERSTLLFDLKPGQMPIVFHPAYDISFLGLEKCHPFDAAKWGKIFRFLKDGNLITDDTYVQPLEATQDDLMVVHTERYLNSLKWSVNVARIMEVPPVALLPNFIVQRKALKPFRFHTGGTILAAYLAVKNGWAINLGGGFHHCSSDRGGGFCAYADITLAIRFLQLKKLIKTALIIDLDAHQGNGHERDFMGDGDIFIFDMFNGYIYPGDTHAKRGIRQAVELRSYVEDDVYLNTLESELNEVFSKFQADLIVYNAGTDSLDGDPLGCLSLTPEGISKRDEMVFRQAQTRRIPIVMLTSGGYQRNNAAVIADSILNLRRQKLIENPPVAHS